MNVGLVVGNGGIHCGVGFGVDGELVGCFDVVGVVVVREWQGDGSIILIIARIIRNIFIVIIINGLDVDRWWEGVVVVGLYML
jgi:hypothetical protein